MASMQFIRNAWPYVGSEMSLLHLRSGLMWALSSAETANTSVVTLSVKLPKANDTLLLGGDCHMSMDNSFGNYHMRVMTSFCAIAKHQR
eukprot:1157725-Pelagomonas_calceolata.AAC.8